MADKTVRMWIEDNGDVKIEPETVHVSLPRQESVVWRCDDGAATILFDKREGSPFRVQEFHSPAGGFVGSGAVVRGQPGDTFGYTVIINRANDKRPYRKDPQVIVDNGA